MRDRGQWRDAAANTAKIESLNFDGPLDELLDWIEVEVIADHWLARFTRIGDGCGGRICKNRRFARDG